MQRRSRIERFDLVPKGDRRARRPCPHPERAGKAMARSCPSAPSGILGESSPSDTVVEHLREISRWHIATWFAACGDSSLSKMPLQCFGPACRSLAASSPRPCVSNLQYPQSVGSQCSRRALRTICSMIISLLTVNPNPCKPG